MQSEWYNFTSTLIRVVTKGPNYRLQNVPTITKRPNSRLQNVPTITKRPNSRLQNVPTITKGPNSLLQKGPTITKRLNSQLQNVPTIILRNVPIYKIILILNLFLVKLYIEVAENCKSCGTATAATNCWPCLLLIIDWSFLMKLLQIFINTVWWHNCILAHFGS